MTQTQVQRADALVVGAGFGGIYQLKKLVDLGLSVVAIDRAADVGGTWFWNRYPGAMSDTESYLYRYSWDLEDLKTYPWAEHYVQQDEILAYLEHVVKRHDLRKHMQFNTELTSANWDESQERWIVGTSTGVVYEVRYLVTALGLLSRHNFPVIAGIDSFKGEMYHTGAWPQSATMAGKRVGVIGNGSTGVQIITALAPQVEKLVSFQRNPQYSVPSGNRPVDPEYRKMINENYAELWREAKDDTLFSFGFKETDRPTFSVSPEERERIFEAAWQKGGGFRFMFETFGDISVDEAANKEASDFIIKKIQGIVKDSEKVRKLTPTQLYARRPLCDSGYYQQFNRDNVELVSLADTPIQEITSNGIKTSDGVIHELDVIVFATGFDAVDGNYVRAQITGRNGESLKKHWMPQGSTSYLGVSVPNFPNMFMILGPNGPFCNLPPAIETHVEFISDIIEAAEKKFLQQKLGTNGTTNGTNGMSETNGTVRAHPIIEATPQAEEEWTVVCDKMSADSLFRKTDSWIFGANVEGKKNSVLFFFGGLGPYRKILRDIVSNDFKGYKSF